MSRAREAAAVLAAALVVGGVIGWLLSGGPDSGATPSAASGTPTTPSAVLSSVPSTSHSTAVTEPSQAGPSVSASTSSGSTPTLSLAPSALVSAGAITVTVNPPTATAYAPMLVTGTVEGATPGTTLEFARKSGPTLATTQVGQAGSYRLTVKLGRSGTFVVRTVDGPTVLASSAPFTLVIT